MKFCTRHWQALVDALDARGLADHSHVTIDTSAAGLLAQAQQSAPADLGTFDALGDAVSAVILSLGRVDLDAPGCPVCNATTKTDVSKIVQAADQTLATFDDLTTAELQTQMASLFAALGITTVRARLDYAARVVDKPVASLDDLTVDELSAVIEALAEDLRAQKERPAPKTPAKATKGGA